MTDDDADDQLVRLTDDDARIYQDARRWFLERGGAVVAHLAKGLEDPRLGSIGHWRILLVLRELRDPSTLPAIVKAFHDAFARRNPMVLPGAMEALAVFDSDSAWAALISALASDDPDTVNHAAALLAQKGGPRAEQAIATLLRHPGPAFRQSGVSALSKLDTESAREMLRRHKRTERDPAVLKLLESLR